MGRCWLAGSLRSGTRVPTRGRVLLDTHTFLTTRQRLILCPADPSSPSREGAIGGPQRRSHQVGIPNAEALGPATGKGQRGGVAHGRVLTETAARTFSVSPLAAREAMRDRAAGARTGEAVVRRITPRGGHEAVGRLSLARGPDDLRAYHRGPQDVSDLHFERHAMVASVGSQLDGRLSLLPAGRRRPR